MHMHLAILWDLRGSYDIELHYLKQPGRKVFIELLFSWSYFASQSNRFATLSPISFFLSYKNF